MNKNITAEYTVIIEHDPVTGLYCGQCQQLPEAIELVLDDRAENIKHLYSGRPFTRRRIAVNA